MLILLSGTVDGRNPAPPNMYETLQRMGYLPYQRVGRISSINRMILSAEFLCCDRIYLFFVARW